MKKNGKRLDQKGSTLILVMVIISFLMILGSLLMTMTATNLRLKIYDKKSKQNQYEGESGMAELKTGINELSAVAMQDAYQNVFDRYVDINASTDGLTNNFDKLYLNEMMHLLTGGAYTAGAVYDPAGYEYNIDVLKSYLSTDEGEDGSIRDNFVTLNPAGENPIEFPWAESGFSSDCEHYILLRDVTMRCRDEEGYQVTITTDIRMDCPAVFFASSGIYPEYTQYSLIADDTLTFDGARDQGGYTVKGNVYAGAGKSYSTASQSNASYPESNYPYHGDGGIWMTNNSQSTIMANTIITRANLSVRNNNALKIMGNTVGNTSLWAHNIETIFQSVSSSRTPSPAELVMEATCNISDDLQLNAHNSSVTLKGNYNGFSYNLKEDIDEEYTNASYSSAILVNGQKSTLDFRRVDELSLAGRAFISRTLTSGQTVNSNDNILNPTRGNDILTGEVVTIKSNQIAYMIPDEYILYGHNPVLKSELESKPVTVSAVMMNELRNDDPDLWNLLSCSIATASALATDIVGDGYTAFHYNSGDINAAGNGMVPVVYYYYEFKNQEAANEYYKKYIESNANRKRLTNLAKQFIGNDIDSHIMLNASLLPAANAYANISYYDDTNNQMAIDERSSAINSTQLAGPISTAREYYSRQLSLIADYEGAGTDYRFDDLSGNAEDKGQKRLYDLLIDRTAIETDSAAGAAYGFDSNKVKIVEIPDRDAKVYIVDNYHGSAIQTSSLESVGSSNMKGIIVTTGDLILNTNFTGLIITGGELTVNSSGHATADKRLVQYILKYIVAQEKAAMDGVGDAQWLDVKRLSLYFKEYEAKDSLKAVDLVDVSEFTYYENWAKNRNE